MSPYSCHHVAGSSRYRTLDATSLKVGVLSFRIVVSFGTRMWAPASPEILVAPPPPRRRVNFFDDAEAYANGERSGHGRRHRRAGFARGDLGRVVEVLLGLTPGVNTEQTLNRKYLVHAIDGSLERFGSTSSTSCSATAPTRTRRSRRRSRP